jgi:ribosomal protein L35
LNEYETQFLVKGGFKFKTAFKMHYQTGRKRKTKKNFDVNHNHSVWDVQDCQTYQRLLNTV